MGLLFCIRIHLVAPSRARELKLVKEGRTEYYRGSRALTGA